MSRRSEGHHPVHACDAAVRRLETVVVASLRFKVHAIIQMDERGLTVQDVRAALDNGEDIESRPDEHPYPARLVLGMSRIGVLHVAVRDNIGDDEVIVETAYRPDPALWEPDFKTRRKSQ